jgi:hypothetical protein
VQFDVFQFWFLRDRFFCHQENSMPAKTKRRTVISIRPSAAYWKALGRFIEEFSSIEAVMLPFLGFYAGISHRMARCVFSGVKPEAAIGLINRIVEAFDPGEDRRRELAYMFDQLGLINGVRNVVIHHSSFVTSDQGRIASTIAKAHAPRSIREVQVSPAILDAMTADLKKIGFHMVAQLNWPKETLAQRTLKEPLLGLAWQYKPQKQSQPPDGKRRQGTGRPSRGR